MSPKEALSELEKCKNDPFYFFTNYCHVYGRKPELTREQWDQAMQHQLAETKTEDDSNEESRRLVRVTKLEEPENAEVKNNKAVGYTKEGYFMSEPKVGQSFYLSTNRIFGSWATSTVREIIDENTFRTRNSIYHWEFVELPLHLRK